MIVTDSPIPERRIEIKNFHPVTMLSLNEIFRESMQGAYAYPDIIVRCETLPQIKGNRQEILNLFRMLTKMITSNRPAGPRLFLYVDCSEEIREAGQEQDFKNYQVRFYTNITAADEWRIANSAALSDCERIVANHKGKFQVNNIYNTGCLFTISLAGKFV
jgi:hypothetical protein